HPVDSQIDLEQVGCRQLVQLDVGAGDESRSEAVIGARAADSGDAARCSVFEVFTQFVEIRHLLRVNSGDVTEAPRLRGRFHQIELFRSGADVARLHLRDNLDGAAGRVHALLIASGNLA